MTTSERTPSFGSLDELMQSNVHIINVLPHHVTELFASDITPEMITAAGIYSETDFIKLGALLGWRKLPRRMCPAIVFPFTNLDGQTGYSRAKPDTPRVLGAKKIKYESPLERPNEIYLPPGVAQSLLQDFATIYFTEGEKKSLCLKCHEYDAVGLVGVYGWKDSKGERLLAALERINWQGRQVVLVFDSDAVDNHQVLDAECRFAKLLQQRGATVLVVRLPPGTDANGDKVKVGVDDYLFANGKAAFEELVKSAQPPAEPSPSMQTKAGAEEIDPGSSARAILDAESHGDISKLRYYRGGWIYWKDGAYREQGGDEIRARVVRWLDGKYCKLKQSDSSNVLDVLRAHAMMPADLEPPRWIGTAPVDWSASEVIAMASSILHIPTLVAEAEGYSIPATPRLFVTNALDYDFAPEAPRPATWLTFLNQLWGDDAESIQSLQEWFGYCLTQDTSLQKLLLLVGPPRSGKGTIARVLGMLIGQYNVAGPTLASMETNFGLEPLLGKSLAIIADARLSSRSEQSKIVERLLSISGEDVLTVDRKFLKGVTCKIGARLMIVSNELPRLAESSGALVNRMIILRLTETFIGKEDTGLTARLLTELPGILWWAIGGWKSLRDRGYFVQPAASAELSSEMDELSSPVGMFVRDRCELDPAATSLVPDLYSAWVEWCGTIGRDKPGTQQSFGRDLRAAVPKLRQHQPRHEGRRVRAYEGIRLAGQF